LSEIEQSPAELFIYLRIFAHVILRCDLDLWPLDLEFLQHFGCHAFKLCTKFEQNRIIHSWVIDDLAHLRLAILEDGVGGVIAPKAVIQRIPYQSLRKPLILFTHNLTMNEAVDLA